MTSAFKITFTRFNDLSLEQMYAIVKLRQDVFILEQRSLYVDIDGLDQDSWHLSVYAEGELVGYTRVRPLKSQGYKIERVVCAKVYRGQGLGHKLMLEALGKIAALTPGCDVMLSAQTEALAFYQPFGFIAQGKVYDDGGIEHMDMQLSLKKL